MTEPVYNLVFRGEVLEGQDRSAVARRLMALLKIDAPKVKTLFSGQPVVLKRNVTKAVAARFQAAFRDAGARLRVASPEAESTAPAPAAKPTLAQRLAAEDASPNSDGSTGQGAEIAADPSAAPGHTIAQAVAKDLPAGESWALGAQGGDLVSEDELPRVTPVAVDVSHLSAAPANSGSFEDILPPAPPPPPAPDTSALELDAPGADLAVQREVSELELDLSALSLAEAGADLTEGVEVGLPLPIPEPDFDLAPPGAELETLPRKSPPPPPDTSHLDVE